MPNGMYSTAPGNLAIIEQVLQARAMPSVMLPSFGACLQSA